MLVLCLSGTFGWAGKNRFVSAWEWMWLKDHINREVRRDRDIIRHIRGEIRDGNDRIGSFSRRMDFIWGKKCCAKANWFVKCTSALVPGLPRKTTNHRILRLILDLGPQCCSGQGWESLLWQTAGHIGIRPSGRSKWCHLVTARESMFAKLRKINPLICTKQYNIVLLSTLWNEMALSLSNWVWW